MRTIIHMSDLHFGRLNYPTRQSLLQAIADIKPDLVTVSGDLTQRAGASQFGEARTFLDAISYPKIVVPGNHDVPVYNLYLRFADPLSRYQRYISSDLTPVYVDDEIAVLGINTARSLVIAGGRVNREQVAYICDQFSRLGGRQTKIVVTHHPFDLPAGYSRHFLVGRAHMAMEQFAICGVDLFLAGHMHIAHAGSTARYRIPGYSALVVQAGTTTSTRVRSQLNSFNLIRIDSHRIRVETHTWQLDHPRFAVSQIHHFRRSRDGWVPV